MDELGETGVWLVGVASGKITDFACEADAADGPGVWDHSLVKRLALDVITDNDPVEQEKTAEFNALLTNAVIFHNALDIAEIVRRLQEGRLRHRPRGPDPYLGVPDRARPPLRRVLPHELGFVLEAYDPHLDVDFRPLRGDARPRRTATVGQAA
ncbi:hypothetical protein [Streptomyces sp. NPDC054958]